MMTWMVKAVWWGVLGAVVLATLTTVNVLFQLPAILREEGLLAALLRIFPRVLLVGFLCGFVSRFLWAATGRWGFWGKAITGAIITPLYLFGCLMVFGEEALKEYGNVEFLLTGAVIGSIGVPLGFGSLSSEG